MQAQLLGNHIWRKGPFNIQIAFPVVFQRFLYPPIPLSGEIKGFDDAHPLNLLQNCVHQPGFGFLAVRDYSGGSFLHNGSDPEIKEHSGKRQQPNPPVKGEDAQYEHGGVD